MIDLSKLPTPPDDDVEWTSPPPSRLSRLGLDDRRLAFFLIAAVLIGLLLRLVGLGDRAMHHDESLDAWWSWRFLNGTYDGYDPVYHGPLRFYITAGFYVLFGESEVTARLFSALSGAAVIATPWFIRRELGRVGAAAAAVALCISPTMLYYSRFGREDAQIVFLTAVMMVAAVAYMHRPRAATAMVFFFSLACSFAIKESTYLFVLLIGAYALVVLAVQFARRVRAETPWIDRPDSAFTWVWPLAAMIGLLVTVLIGEASDALFPLLALYAVGLTAVVVALAIQANARSTGANPTTGFVFCALAGLSIIALAAIGRLFDRPTDVLDAGGDVIDRHVLGFDASRIFPLVGVFLVLVALVVAAARTRPGGDSLDPTRHWMWHGQTLVGLAGAGFIAAGADSAATFLVGLAIVGVAVLLVVTALPANPTPGRGHSATLIAAWSAAMVLAAAAATVAGIADGSWSRALALFVACCVLASAAAMAVDVARSAGARISATNLIGTGTAIAVLLAGAAALLFVGDRSPLALAITTAAIIIVFQLAVMGTFVRTNPLALGYLDVPILHKLARIGLLAWVLVIVVFLAAFVTFFTVWFRFPGDWASGVTDAVDYWDSQQEVNRGGQPWYYYFYALPLYEWVFVALAVIGSYRALRRPSFATGLLLWMTVGNFILYSYAGERMPWLIAHPLLPILFLAGMGAQQLWERRLVLFPVTVAIAVGVALTIAISYRVNFVTSSDGREVLSQAGQATHHVPEILERIEQIDRIHRIENNGEAATLAISTTNWWPWAWYLRDYGTQGWNPDSGELPDTDMIIADRWAVNPDEYPEYDASLFAMRSWWVPTYGEGLASGWLGWSRDLSLWEQAPRSGTVTETLEPEDDEPSVISDLADGGRELSERAVEFTLAIEEPRPPTDPPPPVTPELDDGRDGCGSVDQYFLVRTELAQAEAEVHGDQTGRIDPVPCASDSVWNVVGDRVWIDSDGNGIYDENEDGIAGVTVRLIDDTGAEATTETDDDGQYRFEGVQPGSYQVIVNPATLPPGLAPTSDLDGDPNFTTSFSVGLGQYSRDIDFGFGRAP